MRVTRSIVPNLFTLLNLFMGFTAIIYISKLDFTKAAIFILAAAVFDMLDGVMARLIKSTSEFGAELDSLCDAVSFGVAPGYMLYRVYFNQLGDPGILFAALPALGGVVRLARFNVTLTNFEDKRYFTGLPIPSSALTIVSYIIFLHYSGYIPEEFKPYFIFSITILTTAAMVSHIKFDNMPRPTKKSIKERPIVSAIFLIGLVLCIITKGKFIFPFMMIYIIGSAIRHFIYWLKEIREAPDDIDETEEMEADPYDLF